MPKNIGSVTKYFSQVSENTAAMTLGATVTAPAATVTVNGMTNYNDGDVVVFIVDPGNASLKQAFTGVKSGSTIINVVWTSGSDQQHLNGATVIDYVTATDWVMAMTGIKKSLNQDGSLITSAVQTALGLGAGTLNGWNALGYTPNTVTALGNRSYSMVFSAVDLTDRLSPGFRIKNTRTVTAQTQCTSLNGTTQYYSKTSPAGMTFTNNFVVSAWVKLTGYPQQTVASRYNGTSGWEFQINSNGQVSLIGYNAGSGNYSLVNSYQSVPLNKWVHISAQLDMATFTATPTTSNVMIDGIDVPAQVSRGGTNPTALIQAGNLEIGSRNGGLTPFGGKIAQVAIYNAKVTEATILASMHQTLAGTETSLISAYSFNNSINDLNANANNLTANGSAVATNADTPFTQTQGLTGITTGTTNYGIITAASFSTNTTLTVQVPEGDTIPTSGGVSAVSYSTQKVPYGFPSTKDKWRVLSSLGHTAWATTSNATYGAFQSGGFQLVIPIGAWTVGQHATYFNGTTTTVWFTVSPTSLTGSTTAAAMASTPLMIRIQSPAAANTVVVMGVEAAVNISSANTYVMYTFGATTSAGIEASDTFADIYADCAYL